MKECEIRPKDLTGQLHRYLLEDRELWLSGRDSFVRVSCPACDCPETKDPVTVRDMTFETCTQCETVFYNPRPHPEHLQYYYANAKSYTFWATHIFPRTEAARREEVVLPLIEKLSACVSSLCIETDVFLEVGAGFGIFIEELRNRVIFKRVIALELTPDLAMQCRSKGLEVMEVPFEKVELDKGSVNCMASFEVLEHLYSPKEFVRRAYSLLSSNSILILTCPNIRGFDFMILGKQKAPNFGLEHMNMFHPVSIKILLENHGFDIVDIVTPGKLDADIVRNQILEGNYSVDDQPFLKKVLIDEWERLGDIFQKFLSDNRLSSNMLVIARKR